MHGGLWGLAIKERKKRMSRKTDLGNGCKARLFMVQKKRMAHLTRVSTWVVCCHPFISYFSVCVTGVMVHGV